MAEHTPSYYAATAIGLKEHRALADPVSCDVCVVGGGFTGLSAALHLAERGYDVILLEAEKLGWGASGRNGGQLNTGQRKDQDYLERSLGKDHARALWDLALEARNEVKARIARHEISCDLKAGGLTAAYKAGDVADLEAGAAHLAAAYDYPHLRLVSRAETAEMLGTEIYHGALLDSDAAHIHPLNYALGLAGAARAAGARLFESSRVTGLTPGQPNVLRSAGGEVRAKAVVLACNGYLERLEPRISGFIMPINNYVLATEPLGEAGARALIRDDVSVADTKFVVDYYRLSADKRLLFGGGETYSRRFPADIKSFVRKYMLRVYPQLAETKIDYAWGGTLAITMNRLPAFGRLKHDIYYAQGYSGQGVALTTVAGKVIAEALAGSAERFDVFARVPIPQFPGGTLLRWPGLVAGMLYYSLRDRL